MDKHNNTDAEVLALSTDIFNRSRLQFHMNMLHPCPVTGRPFPKIHELQKLPAPSNLADI